MASSKAGAVAAALLEAPARSARAWVVSAEFLDQLGLAASHAAQAALHLRLGGITRASACSSAQKERSVSCRLLLIVLASFRLGSGADGGGRTLMASRPPASGAGAYPGSATSAKGTSRRPTRAERAARKGSCSGPRTRPLGPCGFVAGVAPRLELYDLGRARPYLGPCHDSHEVEMHLRLLSVSKGAGGALPFQRAPRAKSEMSCGVAVSKPTTSSIPGSFGSAIEKPFETRPTTTSRASMPDASR